MNTILDTTKLTSIERQCYGTNKINSFSKKAIEHILPQLQKFIGKKIKLANSSKAKIFDIELLDFPYTQLDGGSYRKFLKFEYNSLVLFNDVTVKDRIYESGGYGASYYKKDITLGSISNDGLLVSVYDFETIVKNNRLDTLYNATEQIELQKQIEALEQQIRDLKRLKINY